MPATANPYGLSLVEYKGGKFRAAVNDYYLVSGYANALGQGDPISGAAGGGTCVDAPSAANNAAVAYLNQILGVFGAVNYVNPQGQEIIAPYWPANTITSNAVPATIKINDLPYCVFQIQTNATLGANSTFKNYNMTQATPNAATGQSTVALDVSNYNNTTTSASLKIVGLADPLAGSTNNWTDAFVDVLVIINNHMFKPGTLGA